MKHVLHALAVVAMLLLTGCGTTSMTDYPALRLTAGAPMPAAPPSSTAAGDTVRKLVVVIDGTGNDSSSRTNAGRLYELISDQDRAGLSLFYTEGVGSDGRVIGMATGWGIGHDVRAAYRFLARRYRPGDEIYLIGFSRGAYAARMLAGLIHAAGLPDLARSDRELRAGMKEDAREDWLVRSIYAAYRTPGPKGQPIVTRDNVRKGRLARLVYPLHRPTIRAMALWDTVEALGNVDRTDSMAESNDHYVDQLCNVENAFHAISLDDNRAYSFTPISLVSYNRLDLCTPSDRIRPRVVDEVWFAGAHADVGGTYAPNGATQGHLAGVSMNWMLGRLAAFGLLPDRPRQYAEPLDMIHDAKGYTRAYQFIKRRFRYPFAFANSAATGYNGGKPRFHISVAQRLAVFDSLDALQAGRCRKPRQEKLLCNTDIINMGVFRELVGDEPSGEKDLPLRNIDAVIELSRRPQSCLDRIPGGWRFRGHDGDMTKPLIETKCVTLVGDGPAVPVTVPPRPAPAR